MSPNITGKEYLTCPLCDVDVPLSGDEKLGDQILCIYCECPLKLKKTKEKEDELYLEDDF